MYVMYVYAMCTTCHVCTSHVCVAVYPGTQDVIVYIYIIVYILGSRPMYVMYVVVKSPNK